MGRFNPALVTMLSKGPPGGMAARPLPVKSNSAPELRTTVIEDDIDVGKQLTHLTKGRARGPKKRKSEKRAREQPEEARVEKIEKPLPPKPIVVESPIQKPAVPPKPVPAKRPIIKSEPDSPPPIQSSVWNKPTRVQTTPELLFDATFRSTPDTPSRPVSSSTPLREDQKSSSSSSRSMKRRLAELSPLRRDSKTRTLFGNLLRSPSLPTPKPKYPSLEIIPAVTSTKIPDKERLFVQAWSIVSRVKHVSLPNTEENVLYEKDMHAFLYMFNSEPGALEPSAIKFLWVGRECTLGEKEGMEFVRLMGDQNADTQVIQQGRETPLFVRALGGVIVTRTGTRRPLDSEEDAVFCVRSCLGGISIDPREFRKAEFCSGFSYVIKRDVGDVFVWHGNGSLSEEISAARRFAAQLGPNVKETMEADPTGSSELWTCFYDHAYASGDFWRRKYELNGFSPSLYLIEGQKVLTF